MTVAQLLEEAKMLQKTWRYKLALTSYEEAIQHDPQCIDAYDGKATMLAFLHLPNKALEVYNFLIDGRVNP